MDDIIETKNQEKSAIEDFEDWMESIHKTSERPDFENSNYGMTYDDQENKTNYMTLSKEKAGAASMIEFLVQSNNYNPSETSFAFDNESYIFYPNPNFENGKFLNMPLDSITNLSNNNLGAFNSVSEFDLFNPNNLPLLNDNNGFLDHMDNVFKQKKELLYFVCKKCKKYLAIEKNILSFVRCSVCAIVQNPFKLIKWQCGNCKKNSFTHSSWRQFRCLYCKKIPGLNGMVEDTSVGNEMRKEINNSSFGNAYVGYDPPLVLRKEKRARVKKINPYMLFCKLNRKKLSEQYPNFSFSQIGTLLGKKWNELPISRKKEYKELTDKLMVEESID